MSESTDVTMRIEPIPPGTRVELTDDAARLPGAPEKPVLKKELARLGERLEALQSLLYAESQRALLVVLQGRDTAGKDGTIRNVFGHVNPEGLVVTAFRAPSERELRQDFLWRIHAAVPPKGFIGVFNRSHYEDVLAVRVRGLVPEPVWRARYDQIVAFERILVENGVTILKFLLHISRDEQRRRLLARLDDPAKHWKFDPSDLDARRAWDAYTAAYEDVLARTSTAHAPWYVVPADRKPVRDVLVARTVVETLERMGPKPPAPPPDVTRWRAALDR